MGVEKQKEKNKTMQAIELLPGTVLKAGYEQVFISPELYDIEDQEAVDFVNEDGELIARGVITYSEELRFDDLKETDFDDLEASPEDLLEQLTVRDSNFLEEWDITYLTAQVDEIYAGAVFGTPNEDEEFSGYSAFANSEDSHRPYVNIESLVINYQQ